MISGHMLNDVTIIVFVRIEYEYRCREWFIIFIQIKKKKNGLGCVFAQNHFPSFVVELCVGSFQSIGSINHKWNVQAHIYDYNTLCLVSM